MFRCCWFITFPNSNSILIQVSLYVCAEIIYSNIHVSAAAITGLHAFSVSFSTGRFILQKDCLFALFLAVYESL